MKMSPTLCLLLTDASPVTLMSPLLIVPLARDAIDKGLDECVVDSINPLRWIGTTSWIVLGALSCTVFSHSAKIDLLEDPSVKFERIHDTSHLVND